MPPKKTPRPSASASASKTRKTSTKRYKPQAYAGTTAEWKDISNSIISRVSARQPSVTVHSKPRVSKVEKTLKRMTPEQRKRLKFMAPHVKRAAEKYDAKEDDVRRTSKWLSTGKSDRAQVNSRQLHKEDLYRSNNYAPLHMSMFSPYDKKARAEMTVHKYVGRKVAGRRAAKQTNAPAHAE